MLLNFQFIFVHTVDIIFIFGEIREIIEWFTSPENAFYFELLLLTIVRKCKMDLLVSEFSFKYNFVELAFKLEWSNASRSRLGVWMIECSVRN